MRDESRIHSLTIQLPRSQHPVNYFHAFLYSTAYWSDTVRGHRQEDPVEDRAELYVEPIF